MRPVAVTAVCLTLVLAGCLADGKAAACSDPQASRDYFDQPRAEQTMDDILTNLVQCMPADKARERAENIGQNAGEAVRSVLAAIYSNADPDPAALTALQGDIDLLLRPKQDRFTHTTLLNEAVRQQNLVWVQALLDAGADPNGSGSLMAYTALDEISHPGSPWNHIFRDGSPVIPFLQAYLDKGGNVNTTAEGGFGVTPLLNRANGNLDARVYLLKNGADGWLHDGDVDTINFSMSFFGGRIFGLRSPDYAEELYLLIDRGLFLPPKDELYQRMMHEVLLDMLVEMEGASGPDMRHRLWTIQRVINALIAKKFLSPSAQMTELLARDAIPDAEGGWILQAGQLHQPHDDSRVGAVLGTEVW